MKKLFFLPLLICFFACESSPEQDLVDAVKNEDKTKVEKLLENGADPNADGSGTLSEGTTATIEAACTGNLELFEMVVAAGGDPSVELEFGTMIIRLFPKLGQAIGHALASCSLDDKGVDDFIAIVNKCVELGADIGATSNEGDFDMDMHLETEHDSKNAIILVAANSSIGIDDIDETCLPHMKKMLQTFQGHGCTIDQQNNWGYTALIYHVKRRNMNMIRLLVDLGADINKTGGDMDASPLWYALWTEEMYSSSDESEYHLLFENDNDVTDYLRSKGAKEYCNSCN